MITPTSKDEVVNGYQLIVDGLMGVKRTSAMLNEVKPRKQKAEITELHPNQTGGVQFDEVPNL